MSGRKIVLSVYITPEQNVRLRELSEQTKVPVAEFIRAGVDHVLKKSAQRLQLPLFGAEKHSDCDCLACRPWTT